MEAAAQPTSRRVLVPALPWDAAAAWLLGFAPAVYLALSGGGYDIVVRSEVGVVVWWIVLLGAIVGVWPRTRWGHPAWVAVALLAGFLAWTWIATGWSQNEEATLAEVARVATYLGVLVLGLCVVSRATVRPLLSGLAAAIAVVCLLAVLSELVPAWFPRDSTASLYATSRLRYPFDYSDGVGEFAALGIPLLLYLATGARTIIARALAAGALPVVTLCVALTVSRGGILATAVGLVVFFALVPDRVPRLATALVASAATAVLMVALLNRVGLRDTLLGPAPAAQRHAMLVVLVLACVGAALAQAGLTLLLRYGARPRALRFSRRQARGITAVLVAGVAAIVIVGFAAGTIDHLWQQFKQPNPPAAGNSYFRLLSLAGSHRYQYWQVAMAAFHSSPWKGIGPGNFQFYWAQHNNLAEFVRNAHSLWFETLAELGIPGLALIGGLFAFAIVAGAVRALRAAAPERPALATAVAGIAAFCAAAAFDWVWQLGAVPFVAMLLLAAALGGSRPALSPLPGRRLPRWLPMRVALAIGTLVALWAIVIPLSETVAVRASQTAAGQNRWQAALADASTAQQLEPSAASPRLQRALLLEQLGDVSGAANAIAQAETRAPTDWQVWLTASRIATEQNKPRLALALYRRARSLNPTSPIFAQ